MASRAKKARERVAARKQALREATKARERWEASTADEIKKLRGELARLKMSNEVLTKELHKMKTLVGAANPAADGAGVDVDALASKRELESIRVELSKLRRQGSQDHEALRLEVQQIKRALAEAKISHPHNTHSHKAYTHTHTVRTHRTKTKP